MLHYWSSGASFDTHIERMSIWVSKEALAAQDWSQLCQISLTDRFRAKNVNILISNFSFVFFWDFLCIIEVWGAQWILNISLWFLWKPHQIYPKTSMSKNNFGYPSLWKLWDTLTLTYQQGLYNWDIQFILFRSNDLLPFKL